MRYGLTLRAHGGVRRALDTALAAGDAGFQSVYVTESHFDTLEGFANPYAVAAAISGRLQRISIGVAPAIGLEHPLRLVEQANMLDVLTRGRSLMVLSDRPEPLHYAGFGLPVPRNGLFEDLVQHLEDAWSWEYQEDGPPLEFQSGPYTAKLAGRIMPAACPRLALETDSEVGVRDAARRGRSVHIRAVDLQHARSLIDRYREALISGGHSVRRVENALDGLTVVVVSETFAASTRELETLRAAEVRFNVPLEDAIRLIG